MEYVLMYEIVHVEHVEYVEYVEHVEHGAAFGEELGRRIPDYEARRECFRELGAGLMW
jgi:hypothetical protein